MKIINVQAREVIIGDEMKVKSGWAPVNGVHAVKESEGRYVESKDVDAKVGLVTPKGMFGLNPEYVVTVRRRSQDKAGKYRW